VTTLTPERTPEGWGRAAAEYERVILRITLPFAVECVERLALGPGERVIDVACGPGTASFVAEARGASVLAVDFAPEMIARLGEAVRERGIKRIEPVVMDGQALDVEDGSFDAAMCVFGLMFFLDQQAGVDEMLRVLRPDGRAGVVTWGSPDRNLTIRTQRDAVVAALPELPPFPEPPPVFSLSDPSHLEELMRTAGLVDVRVEPVQGQSTFERPEGLWDLLGASPVFDSVKAAAGDRLDLVRHELMRLAEERFGPGPLSIPSEALIATGARPSS
jgi:SAM-dependent methyltransferase